MPARRPAGCQVRHKPGTKEIKIYFLTLLSETKECIARKKVEQ